MLCKSNTGGKKNETKKVRKEEKRKEECKREKQWKSGVVKILLVGCESRCIRLKGMGGGIESKQQNVRNKYENERWSDVFEIF